MFVDFQAYVSHHLKRERASARGVGRGRGKGREAGSLPQGLIPGPLDHDLS